MGFKLKEFFSKKGNIIVVAFVITTFLLIGSYFYIRITSQSIQREKENDLRIISEFKINQLVQWHKERNAEAKLISKSRFFIKGLYEWLNKKNDTLLLKDLLEKITTFRNEFDYETIMVTTLHAELLISLDNKKFIDKKTIEKIKSASITKEITFTDFYYCEEEKKIHYDIIIPLILNSNTPFVIAIFRIDPNKYLFPIIQSWPELKRSAETLIFRREGEENVLFLNVLQHQKSTALQFQMPISSSNSLVVQALSGKIGIVNGIDYKGNEVIAYISPIPGTVWFMKAKVDRDEIYSELRVRSYFIAVFTSILIISLIAGLAWVYSSRQRDIYRVLFNTQEEFIITLQSIGDAVITTDTKGIVRFLNPVAQTLTGWTFTEAKNKRLENVFNIISEDTRQIVESPVSKIIKDGLVVGLANHTLLISKTGKEIPIADSGAPIKDKNGNIIGVVLVFRDQTEERLNHKLLNARVQLLQYSIYHNLTELLTKTLDNVCELTESSIGFYHLVEKDQENIKLLAWSTKTKEEFYKAEKEALHYKISDAKVLADCIKEKKAVIYNDYLSLPHKKGLPEENATVIRECIVPIRINNTVVAIIGIGNKTNDYSNKDVEIVEYFGTAAWEIYEKKRVDEEFFEAQRKFKSTVNNLKGFVYRCRNDRDWTMEYVSDAIENITGYKSSDFINNKIRSFNSIIHSDDQKRVWEAVQKAIVIKESYVLTYRIITAENEIRWVWESGRGVFEKDNLIALEGFVDDVTDEKLALEALKENEIKLRNLVENSTNLFYSHDTNHTLLYVSPQIKNILGYEVEEALVKWTDLVSDNPINKIGFDKTVKAIETGIAQGTYELEMIHKSGKKVWVEVREAPIVENGKTVSIVGSLTDISEKIIAEQQLKTSEERYRIVAEQTGQLIYDYNVLNGSIQWAGNIEKLTGFTKEEFQNFDINKWESHIHPDDKQEALAQLDYAMKNKVEYLVNYRFRKKDGSYIITEDDGIFLYDSNGNAYRMLGTMKDISERKKNEDALRESEEKLRVMFETSIEGICMTDADDNIIWVNPRFEQMLGYSPKEVLNMNYNVLIPNEQLEDYTKKNLERSKGKSDIFERKLIRKEGIELWAAVSASPIYDKFGKYNGQLRMATDITVIKAAQEEIRKFYIGVEQSPISVMITDIDGKIEYVNSKFSTLTGYTYKEVFGENPRFLSSGHKTKEEYKELWDTILSGKSWVGEFLNKKKNGELFWEAATIYPLINDEGRISHFIAMKEDITQRKKMTEELIRAREKAIASEKVKSEFLAQMSHEIRTPLNIILGNTSFIKEELITNELKEFIDVFDAIEYSSKRIIRTIDLILNMAELQTGVFIPALKEVDIDKEIIRPLIQEHHSLAASKNLELNYECKIKNAKYFVDEYCVMQIFANLIDNAIKYTNKGKVEVKLFKNKSENIVVEVKDTGIGIGKEYMQNLFKPFEQEEKGYTRTFEGNGLGLALVKNYCDLNNAKIEVESTKGIGSTFRVIFHDK
jgi:PAS domain S-box-containing protein